MHHLDPSVRTHCAAQTEGGSFRDDWPELIAAVPWKTKNGGGTVPDERRLETGQQNAMRASERMLEQKTRWPRIFSG